MRSVNKGRRMDHDDFGSEAMKKQSNSYGTSGILRNFGHVRSANPPKRPAAEQPDRVKQCTQERLMIFNAADSLVHHLWRYAGFEAVPRPQDRMPLLASAFTCGALSHA